MKILKILIPIFLGCSSAASAAVSPDTVSIPNGYYSGLQFQKLPENIRQVYVAGVVDGMLYAPFFGANEARILKLKNCITGIRSDQLARIVEAYLHDNPEYLDASMHFMVGAALTKACTKRGSPAR